MHGWRSTSAPHWQVVTLLLLTATAGALFSWAAIAQHRAYYSSAYDLAWFDQVVWNTAHGHWFATSFRPWNFLGEHCSPALLLFAALYRVASRAELLLAVQAAALAGAAIPCYLAAARVLGSATAGLLVAAAYLLAPQLHGAVVDDFHTETLGAPLIFSAFALLAARHPGWAVAMLAGLFTLKEDAAIVAAGFALLLWRFGYRRYAVAVLAGAAVFFVTIVLVVMPYLRGGVCGNQCRYGYLTAAPGESATVSSLRHAPERAWGQIWQRSTRETLTRLGISLALLPLASPAILAVLPLLLLHLLSGHAPQHTLQGHYAVLLLPLMLVTAILGIDALRRSRWLGPLCRWLRLSPAGVATACAGVLCLMEAAAWREHSLLGGAFEPERYRQTAHTAAIRRVLRAAPPDLPVSAQTGLLPHLSGRRHIAEFPSLAETAGSPRAMVVVVDRKRPWWAAAADADYHGTLAALSGLGYCLVQEDDGVELYLYQEGCAP